MATLRNVLLLIVLFVPNHGSAQTGPQAGGAGQPGNSVAMRSQLDAQRPFWQCAVQGENLYAVLRTGSGEQSASLLCGDTAHYKCSPSRSGPHLESPNTVWCTGWEGTNEDPSPVEARFVHENGRAWDNSGLKVWNPPIWNGWMCVSEGVLHPPRAVRMLQGQVVTDLTCGETGATASCFSHPDHEDVFCTPDIGGPWQVAVGEAEDWSSVTDDTDWALRSYYLREAQERVAGMVAAVRAMIEERKAMRDACERSVDEQKKTSCDRSLRHWQARIELISREIN